MSELHEEGPIAEAHASDEAPVEAPAEVPAEAPAEESAPEEVIHADLVEPVEAPAVPTLEEVDVVDVPSEPVEHEAELEVAALGQAHAEIQESIASAYPPAEAPAEDEDQVVRKVVSEPNEAELVRAGEARISRILLAEIDQRRSLDDIGVLIAAVHGLLDEVEKSG